MCSHIRVLCRSVVTEGDFVSHQEALLASSGMFITTSDVGSGFIEMHVCPVLWLHSRSSF